MTSYVERLLRDAAGALSLGDLPDYAVAMRAIGTRGWLQQAALAELGRRGTALLPDQQRAAAARRSAKIRPRPDKMSGRALMEWREMMGWSRDRACRELGCSVNALRRWEEGGDALIPNYIGLACVALALGVSEMAA